MVDRPFRLGVIGLAALAAACSSSPSTGSQSASTTNTTNVLAQGRSRQIEIQSCVADFINIQAALNEYKTKVGSYLPPPAPWSHATYRMNYKPLLTSQAGGPYIQKSPDATRYVIEYDSMGRVWVEPAHTYVQSVNVATASPNGCSLATQ